MGSEGRNRHLTDSFVGLFREAYISTRSKDYDGSLQCVYICTNFGRSWKVQIKLICGIHFIFGLSHFIFWVTTLFEFHCFPQQINGSLLSKLSPSGLYDLLSCRSLTRNSYTHGKNERHKKQQKRAWGGMWEGFYVI